MATSHKGTLIKLVAVLLTTFFVWGANTPAIQGQLPDPVSLWDDLTVPTVITESDPNAVELGVRFQADSGWDHHRHPLLQGP